MRNSYKSKRKYESLQMKLKNKHRRQQGDMVQQLKINNPKQFFKRNTMESTCSRISLVYVKQWSMDPTFLNTSALGLLVLTVKFHRVTYSCKKFIVVWSSSVEFEYNDVVRKH